MATIEAGQKAINTLDVKSIQELKGFSAPPAAVKTQFEAVCVLLNLPKTWKDAQKLMANPREFLERLLNVDKNGITNKQKKELQKYLDDPELEY